MNNVFNSFKHLFFQILLPQNVPQVCYIDSKKITSILCCVYLSLTLKCRKGETKIVISAIFFLDRQKMLLRWHTTSQRAKYFCTSYSDKIFYRRNEILTAQFDCSTIYTKKFNRLVRLILRLIRRLLTTLTYKWTGRYQPSGGSRICQFLACFGRILIKISLKK